MLEYTEVDTWSCDDVAEWLQENGFDSYVNLFCKKHKIDGQVLLTLTEADLKQPPLQIVVLGDLKRLLICLKQLNARNGGVMSELGITNGNISPSSSSPLYQHSPHQVLVQERHTINHRYRRLDSSASLHSEDSVDFDDSGWRKEQSCELKPEKRKMVIAFIYMFTAFLITSCVMVIVHDRVPDMKKYPPLPDIVLDNMPFIPWAFQMCEATGCLLSLICAVILFFHKHRFIILRRLFSLTGTVFLLRCVTMLITSLSVPSANLKCEPKSYGDFSAKLNRAVVIWTGFGMTLQGVRTCGDYMFSGHTVVITMLNFFITEYSPRNLHFLHTMTWVLNLFGIFFILAAHEHYSIDVFVAFYITSRLFLYYHSLANNRALMQPDRKRTRNWFPLFSFFESRCNEIVPNVYEWPFPWPAAFKEAFKSKRR